MSIRLKPESDVTLNPLAKKDEARAPEPQKVIFQPTIKAPTPQKMAEPPVKRSRGRPPSGNETVTLRMSSAVLAKYRATGEGWQARLNADLIRLCGL